MLLCSPNGSTVVTSHSVTCRAAHRCLDVLRLHVPPSPETSIDSITRRAEHARVPTEVKKGPACFACYGTSLLTVFRTFAQAGA